VITYPLVWALGAKAPVPSGKLTSVEQKYIFDEFWKEIDLRVASAVYSQTFRLYVTLNLGSSVLTSKFYFKEDDMKQTLGRPSWVAKVQKQGLTPAVLEGYLNAGWPVSAIAEDRHLDVDDVINAMKRWDIEIGKVA
jgi:hypothetical protein